MRIEPPGFKIHIKDDKEREIKTADDALDFVKGELEDLGLHVQQAAAGWALVGLFGRLVELVFTRLDQVPDKHFLAFLNEAGVDLLPPRPASAELTFTLQEDGPASIRVPTGTQVATVQTETQPEVIFETQRDIVVSPSTLVKCMAFDPLNYSDRTTQATGNPSASPAATPKTGFAAFKGDQERTRALYIGDDDLFSFPDDATRQGATIDFCFEVKSQEGAPDWRLVWEYYDEEDTAWKRFSPQPAHTTQGLLKDGVVTFTALPPIGEYTITDKTQQWTSRWVRARLTGGASRAVLPTVDTIKGTRSVSISSSNRPPDLSYYNPIESAAYIPLDLSKQFYPLGTRPRKHDTFYVAADEPLSKPGATVTLTVQIEEKSIPSKEVRLVWEYYDGQKWQWIGTSSTHKAAESASGLSFHDTTKAFTAKGQQTVSFTLPDSTHPSLRPPQPVAVNEQEYHWLRVRMVQGLYGQEGYWDPTDKRWVPEVLYPPTLKSLTLGYTYQPAPESPTALDYCLGQVDFAYVDHSAASKEDNRPFSPFSAPEEGPALYLGFKPAFPTGKWIQMLLDVQEETQTPATWPAVFWEYWNGSQWATLRASDASRGLREREYLGFFGPEDHKPRIEFGKEAHWLRARPHLPPLANAGDDQEIPAEDGETTVTLDGSRSEAFDPQRGMAAYTWRLVSSSPPMADAGPDQTVATQGDDATVHLNASGSQGAEGRPIVRYIWRRPEAGTGKRGTTIATPFLKAIRVNTAAALNAVTIRDEALGSSDGKPNQVFTLQRPPVLPGAYITVREPDRPPDDELEQLQKELLKIDKTAQALLSETEAPPREGTWVRWNPVSDFHASTPASRHFTLDPITGEVCFGDGRQGKIPPVGRNNIKAVFYRTLDGAKGNLAAGTITMLRNPSGDLANIKTVTNPERAAGGSDSKPVDEVRRRGPQSLKHRQRAVTPEDFVWLAREASGEVAQARCLPARNALGLPEPGWVTVVITPESQTAKPTPTPGLLRRVKAYLKERGLVNLKAVNHIHVMGPEYIEATVLAQVVPKEPDKADTTKLAVLEQLETFLHPLRGGPERQGWELGRDVYLSEVCAEVEGVPGVNHVALMRLLASLQQVRIQLGPKEGAYQEVPFDVSAGSQVSTFDERIKLLLAEPLRAKEELRRLAVYGFKVGDHATIVAADNTVLKENLTISSLSHDSITFKEPFALPEGADALSSADRRLRLPLSMENATANAGGKVTAVRVKGFEPGDKVSLVVGSLRHPGLELLPVEGVKTLEDRIFVPEGHLIYSGGHDIEMVLE